MMPHSRARPLPLGRPPRRLALGGFPCPLHGSLAPPGQGAGPCRLLPRKRQPRSPRVCSGLGGGGGGFLRPSGGSLPPDPAPQARFPPPAPHPPDTLRPLPAGAARVRRPFPLPPALRFQWTLPDPLSPPLPPKLPLASWAARRPRRTAGPAAPPSSRGSRAREANRERVRRALGAALARRRACVCAGPDTRGGTRCSTRAVARRSSGRSCVHGGRDRFTFHHPEKKLVPVPGPRTPGTIRAPRSRSQLWPGLAPGCRGLRCLVPASAVPLPRPAWARAPVRLSSLGKEEGGGRTCPWKGTWPGTGVPAVRGLSATRAAGPGLRAPPPWRVPVVSAPLT